MANKTVNGNTLEVPSFDGKKAEVKISTVLRLVFLIAAYVNQICDVFGAYDAFIPERWRSAITVASLIATGVASVCAYWFNNSWSAEATVADKLLATIKHASTYCPEIVESVNNTIAQFNNDNKGHDVVRQVESPKSTDVPEKPPDTESSGDDCDHE